MLLRLHQIDKFYPTGEGPLHVLHGIDLSLEAGKSLALTGEFWQRQEHAFASRCRARQP